ncbi:hypothetical protein SteCoe_33421 [Stentor coeruleus]|uniref:Uncharacterized protein n=1 Tax=Stentor coeruleus TaxID=5963 RepID=A0A1R2AWQ7_9CILI|nr:hypothetical protein SteCoe_33421 [Stentor coeruleus]
MGNCIKAKSKKGASETVNIPPPAENLQPAVAPPPQSQAEPYLETDFLFKVEPNQAKIYLYSLKHSSAFTLPVSVPFKFRRACSICYLGNHVFMAAGGYEVEDELSKDVMIFDINKLSGFRAEDMPTPCVSTTLIYYKKAKYVFSVGGLQTKLNDSNIEEFYDYKGSDFYCYHLEDDHWESLENCPKQLCLPTCYLRDDMIFVCGGFSSVQDESKFVKRNTVYRYDIARKKWDQANFDHPIATIGSVAMHCSGKTLVLGGFAEYNNFSTKVFTISGSIANNVRDFNIANMVVLSPGFQSATKIFFLAEPDLLLTYDIKASTIAHESLHSLHPPTSEFFTKKIGFNPRAVGIYVYMAECSHKSLRDFNIISQESSVHNLKNIQFRDSGVLVLNDGKVFFAGGVGTSTSKAANLCFIYDTLTQEEKEAPALPSPLRGLRLVEQSGIIYAVAGFDDEGPEVLGYCYVINTHEWRKLNNMMHSTRYPCCFILKNSLYAIGGEEVDEDGVENVTNYVQVMDFESKVWTSKVVTYPHNGKSMGSLQVTDDTVLVFGGEDNEGNALNECYLFDGETFVNKSNLPDNSSTYTFESPGLVYDSIGYIYSTAGVLFQVDLATFEWNEIEVEQEFTNN